MIESTFFNLCAIPNNIIFCSISKYGIPGSCLFYVSLVFLIIPELLMIPGTLSFLFIDNCCTHPHHDKEESHLIIFSLFLYVLSFIQVSCKGVLLYTWPTWPIHHILYIFFDHRSPIYKFLIIFQISACLTGAWVWGYFL